MKIIKLHGKWGEGLETIVSDEDYLELNKYRWYITRDIKTPKINYVARSAGLKGGFIHMHRQIIGDKPGYVVDHINRNPLDNRRENLRHATPHESVLNRDSYIIQSSYKNGKGYGKGYTKVGNKYQVQCKIFGKSKYLGMFKTPEEAHDVYINYLKESRGLTPIT